MANSQDERHDASATVGGDWPKPSVAVDAVVLTTQGRDLYVLVHRRQAEPHVGQLALPGVFLLHDEPPEDAVRRALKVKGHLSYDGPLQLVSVENHPGRDDPRGWVITLVHLALMPWWEVIEATEEASGVRLLGVTVPWRDALGEPVALHTLGGESVHLAFDHEYLIGQAIAWLRREIWRTPLPLRLVRGQFTLRQLQDAYESLLGEDLFRTTFRRRMVDTLGLIQPTGDVASTDPRRPDLFRAV